METVFTNNGVLISGDDDVLALLTGIDEGEFTPLDTRGIRPDFDELARLYAQAQATKTAADADAYKRHKDRILMTVTRRNSGEAYE